MDIEQIDREILNRISIRNDNNEYYFPEDKFQAIPTGGYTKLIENMLDHPSITINLNTNLEKNNLSKYLHCFNSMSIDEFFDNIYGALPYRSIKFHHHSLPISKIFPVSVVNFTHREKFTRVTEWKNLPGHGRNEAFSSLTFEEPCDYSENNFERYYPVKDFNQKNRGLYKKYLLLTPDNVTFIGRCGLYAYLDMHQAISSAMSIAENFIKSDNKSLSLLS
ncbi:hypothetical protein G6720_04160 [Polynucleobacter paneuropaeus]|nr:hypothetical protein G6720_04160 [Polynucleobacter paneuropaeus]